MLPLHGTISLHSSNACAVTDDGDDLYMLNVLYEGAAVSY